MKQKKSLKAYQLFLIGLAVMLFGTYAIGGSTGGIFVFAGLFLWVVAIVVFIKKLINKGGIENSTRSTAKTILTSFLAVKNKYNYPVETPADKVKIYSHVLKLRPGYTDTDIKELLEQAQGLSAIKGSTQGISLNTLVFLVVVREYVQDTNKRPTKEQLAKVESIIAEMF